MTQNLNAYKIQIATIIINYDKVKNYNIYKK